jgi:glycosyltransferase involved in cell wall biosynthesis
MQPIVSLLIATRERANTLAFTLRTTLNQQSPDLEIIVSDNASEDSTPRVVGAFQDSRLRYFRTASRLSMCDNYEFALSKARGRYVIFIGDDDGVMPRALDGLIRTIESQSEQLIYTWPLNVYDWPVDGRSAKVAHYAAPIPARRVQLKVRARRAVELGSWKYYDLPSPYHSAVPREILEAIRLRTGRVFHSTQPDVFTGLAIPAFADAALNLGYSITLNGRSASSNGLGFVTSSAHANIDRFIREYGGYQFHPSLYPGISPRANMIPDAALVAKDLFPELYAGTQFGYDSMWAYIHRLGFVSRREILQARSKIRDYHAFNLRRFLGYSVLQDVAAARRKLLDAATHLGRLKHHPPDNISDFVVALDAQTSR